MGKAPDRAISGAATGEERTAVRRRVEIDEKGFVVERITHVRIDFVVSGLLRTCTAPGHTFLYPGETTRWTIRQ